jgi:lipid-A-disaccharide synthase
MQAAGVEPVVDARSLSVVGLAEVVSHIPRIYKEFRKLKRAARVRRPDVAILTDSPDFHLRLAPHLRALGIPIVYLVAPQVWAWRRGRIRAIRRNVTKLLCIFPFEEDFFRDRQVPAVYIGHPLTKLIRTHSRAQDFRRKHRFAMDRPLVALLPGSRAGEIARHLPALADAVRRMPGIEFALGAPAGFQEKFGSNFFAARTTGVPVRIVEGETWDLIAASDLALAASGTVTVETALLGTPMVTYYKVTGASWAIGKLLVDVPFYSMVNLIAGREVVPELMQERMNGAALATEATSLLGDQQRRERMRADLAEVAKRLAASGDPIERAADFVEEHLQKA